MFQVQKRNGKVIDFDISKISGAIKMAFDAKEKQYNDSIIDLLALKVTADFEPKIKNGIVEVEDIHTPRFCCYSDWCHCNVHNRQAGAAASAHWRIQQ